jgi:hypothetical protein
MATMITRRNLLATGGLGVATIAATAGLTALPAAAANGRGDPVRRRRRERRRDKKERRRERRRQRRRN